MSLPPLSQRLVEFAGADLPSSKEAEAYRKVLEFAQLAWNYSILPSESEASRVVDNGILQMPPIIRASVQQRLFEWVERKRKMFPDDRRIIAHLQIKNSKRHLTVEAASYDHDNPKKKPE